MVAGENPAIPTNFFFARVAQLPERGGSNAVDEGESPSASAMPDGVKVARRFVKPLVLVRVQVWQPLLDLRYSIFDLRAGFVMGGLRVIRHP